MQTDEFDSAIETLVDVFGKGHFPEARVTAIWDLVKELPEGSLRLAVQRFISDSRQAPLPQQIADACKSFGIESDDFWNKYSHDCVFCKGFGMREMYGTYQGRPTTLAASCDKCSYGIAINEGKIMRDPFGDFARPISCATLRSHGWVEVQS